jgi:hypothetical protein
MSKKQTIRPKEKSIMSNEPGSMPKEQTIRSKELRGNDCNLMHERLLYW